ncbi:MAG: cytochrome P450 [Tissierellales bacterium]
MSDSLSLPDPLSPATLSNPYAFWSQLRADSPVHRIEMPGMEQPTYLVARRQDVCEAAMNHEIFSSEVPSSVWRWGNLGPELQPLLEQHGYGIVHTIASADPPAHTYYRSLVGTLFNPRMLASLEPKLQKVIDEKLDVIHSGEPFDLMSSFAIPLPIAMIADILGLPESARSLVERYTEAFVGLVDPSGDLGNAKRSLLVFAEGQQYLWERIQSVEKEPRDDVLGMLVSTRDKEGRALSREELLSLCYIFMAGGNETTRNAIALAGYFLGKQPEVWQALKSDPGKLANFVEEVLRLGTPARLNPRVVKQATTLGGVDLPAGAVVFLLWGSANRDEASFEGPDELCLNRSKPRDHQAFGYGIHRCIGAPLARLELTLSIKAWLKRYASWQFAVPSEMVVEAPLFGFRTFSELPIVVTYA